MARSPFSIFISAPLSLSYVSCFCLCFHFCSCFVSSLRIHSSLRFARRLFCVYFAWVSVCPCGFSGIVIFFGLRVLIFLVYRFVVALLCRFPDSCSWHFDRWTSPLLLLGMHLWVSSVKAGRAFVLVKCFHCR